MEPTRLQSWFARSRPYLPLLAALPVLWHLVVLTRIFALRLTYPMDAEWMEGGALYHAQRWLEGKSLYGPPTQGFVPYGYPPFHFAVLTAAGTVFGLDYPTGRAVSVLSFGLACWVLLREAWRHLDRRPAGLALGLLAVGLAAAGFPVTGGWYDFVRNDSLALALPLLAAGLVSEAPLRPPRIVAVAALLVAAVYTKQTDVFFAAWICLFVTLRQWRRGLLLAAIAAAAAALVFAVAQLVTHGWFLKWITLMGKHKFNLTRLTSGPLTVLRFAPYLYGVPVLVAVLAWKRWLSWRGGLWAGMLLMSVPASILPHIKAGGFLNNLMPVVFLAGPVTLILGADLVKGLRRDDRPRAAAAALAVVLAAAAAVLVVKRYDPAPYLVTAERRQKAVALNELVRGLDGGVLIPDHPFLAARNGVTVPQVHAMAQWDAYAAGVTGDIFGVVAQSPARWLLWGANDRGEPRVLGPYVYDRKVEAGLPSMIGHRAEPNALFRRTR